MAEPKNPKKSEAAKRRWAREHSLTPKQKIDEKDLKEARIEHIVDMMRPCIDKATGQLTWTRKIRKALAASWGITDVEIRRLSSEASARVSEDVDDPEELRRTVGEGMLDSFADALRKKDIKNLVAIGQVMLGMADKSAKRIEVEVTIKQPSAADAALAVREMFGVRVSNDSSTEGADPVVDPRGAQPDDSAPPGSTED
jgi:hypothetical protein